MDSAAAAYFGCGDTNPVPLPKYKGTQITYSTTAGSPDTGSNATTMSIYGVANKRAANYLTAKAVPGGTSSATSPGTTKTVAELNIEVGTAFNAATPTAATVQAVRDATNTIFAQAAQRYIAKITLAAHMPGNGMGGSTRANQAITTPAKNPTKGYWAIANTAGSSWGIWASPDETQATACGGSNAQMPQAQEAPTGVTGALVKTKYSLEMNGGLACSKMTSGDGTATSNTATFRTVQPVVSQTGSAAGQGNGANNGGGANAQSPTAAGTAVATACPTVSGIQLVKNCLPATTSNLPYTVPMVVASTGYVNTAGNKNGGLTNDQIKKATRGLAQTAPVPADTVTPTACIGPDVLFNDVPNTGVATTGAGGAASLGNPHKTGQAVALCDPNGYRPANPADNNANAMVGAVQTARIPVPSAAQTYAANKLWYSGVNSDTANLRRSGVLVNVQKFWDPITAAQASGGAFCCDALYYGTDGIGRGRASPPGNDPPIIDVPKNTDFKPVALTGAAMDQQIVPGGVCTDGNPTTSVKEGLSAASNVEQEEFLEGQAFYTCVAPSQYVLPKVNSVATTQTANAAKQKKCAQTLTGMLKLNKVSAGTKTDDAKCINTALLPATEANQAKTAAGTAACTGTGYSAVEYPLWLVGIGGGTSPASYAVPNGYCYANACLEDFAAVGTATAFKGVQKLSTLQSSPDMSSNPTTQTNACGRANAACAAPPSDWNGGAAIFAKCAKTAGDAAACSLAEQQGQIGMLPSA